MNFKVNDVVHTRDGREVEILKIDAPGDRPIVGYVPGTNEVFRWGPTGKYHIYYTGDLLSADDLLPPKRTREVTVWVNVYPSHEGLYTHESLARVSAKHGGGPVLAVAVRHTFTVEW